MITILPFTSENRHHIKALNVEWLTRYFAVEPRDELQLSNPEEEILQRGGLIYYALLDGTVVGTVTLMKLDESTFELSKMAVTSSVQGQGIGKALMQHCLQEAAIQQVQRLILFSNTRLEAAIALYRKFGFREVDFDATQYKRANIKMELILP